MQVLNKFILAVVVVGLALSPAAHADWLLYADTLVQATADVQKHPTNASHVIFARKEMKNPLVCLGYTNNSPKTGKGKVVTDVLVIRADGSEVSKRLVGNVRKNSALACKEVGVDLNRGAAVQFTHDLRKFSRLRKSATRLDYAEITSFLSTTGVPELGQPAPLGFVPEKGVKPLGVLPQAGTGRYLAGRSLFQVDDDKVSQKHPELVERTLFVQKDFETARVCIAYSNMAENDDAGRIVATAKITRPQDEEIESMKIVGPVRNNTLLKCKDAQARVPKGSVVDVSIELKGLDRLQNQGDLIAFADVTALLATAGEPEFREPPPPPPAEPAEPAEPIAPAPAPVAPATPADPPPSGGSGLSAADEAAAVRLFNSKGVQLQRPKGDSPARFLAVGQKTTLLPGSGHKVDPKTTGLGSTIAAAVADYEKKHRTSFPSGGSLTSTGRSLLAWYGGIDSSAGPTSVRKDASGRYNGEYFRPGRGQQHKTLGTLDAALDWLKKEGL